MFALDLRLDLSAPQSPREPPMSCDVAAATFLMFAAAHPQGAPVLIPAVAQAPTSVAQEPLFISIVGRAGTLKGEVNGFRKSLGGVAQPVPMPHLDVFRAQLTELAALDQQGHELLKARGTDGDLKCILHGISQDLPLKLAAVTDAKTGHDEDLALRDLAYLLNDNVEVITAPPAPAV
jgi:hypothetical protein